MVPVNGDILLSSIKSRLHSRFTDLVPMCPENTPCISVAHLATFYGAQLLPCWKLCNTECGTQQTPSCSWATQPSHLERTPTYFSFSDHALGVHGGPSAQGHHTNMFLHTCTSSSLDLQCTCLLVGPWGVQSVHTNVLQSPRGYPYKSLNRTAIGLFHQSKTLMKQHDSSAQIVSDNHLALDYLLGWEGGVWTVKGITCCMYISNSAQIQTNLQKMTQQVQVFHKLTQAFNHIHTLTLIQGLLFTFLAEPQQMVRWL